MNHQTQNESTVLNDFSPLTTISYSEKFEKLAIIIRKTLNEASECIKNRDINSCLLTQEKINYYEKELIELVKIRELTV